MLAKFYTPKAPSSILLFTIGLWINISTLPINGNSQRDLNLVGAYSNNAKKSSLYVQELDQMTSPDQSVQGSLLYNPDPGSSSIYIDAHQSNHEHLDGETSDESNVPNIYSNDQDETNQNLDHNHHHHHHHLQQKEDPMSPVGNSQDQYENNSPDRITLTHDFVDKTCRHDRGSQRSEQFNETYLSNCYRYKLDNLLSNEILESIMHHETKDCERILEEFIQLDETINQFDNLFMKLLSRYNCHNGYSVKWNCDDCKKAYKDWLCATHLPFYMNGERIKPCISFCERVEQRCPYLHPITREQYGGQPVFICRDPNIPFVPEITPDIPYSDTNKCYDLCHLSDNLTELITDSLSKYDYDKCPDRSLIAGEVRNETAKNSLLLNVVPGSSLSPQDALDYTDINSPEDEENTIILANRTSSSGTKVLLSHSERKKVHVHMKKLEELREVLANYKNQAKTHRYHADHSSIDHSKPTGDDVHHSS